VIESKVSKNGENDTEKKGDLRSRRALRTSMQSVEQFLVRPGVHDARV